MSIGRVLVAARGEIAVRVVRACRDLGVAPVAVYERPDEGALHVRLAEEAHPVASYFDAARLVALAASRGCDAVHPGLGYLAESADFARACAGAGLVFVGPPPAAFDRLANLARVAAAGIPTVDHAGRAFGDHDDDDLRAAADRLGYPVILKSLAGGRGRGARWAGGPDALAAAARRARAEALSVYGDERLMLERALPDASLVGVQAAADAHGGLVSFGERQATALRGFRKLLEEAPAPSLGEAERSAVREEALAIARLLGLRGVFTVELLRTPDGRRVFAEVKGRLQREHPLTEWTTGIDLVVEQLRLAAGERLSVRDADVRVNGAAIACRIAAEDPWRAFLAAPGRVERLRLPGGPGVRVETHLFSGCEVGPCYDPSLIGLSVWSPERDGAVRRLRRALAELRVDGLPTTHPLLLALAGSAAFARGEPIAVKRALAERPGAAGAGELRAVAAAAALAYADRHRAPALLAAPSPAWGWPRVPRGAP